MDLQVKKEKNEDTITLKISGVLDISTNNIIDPYLEEITDEINLLIFDFSGLEFIDSTGIGSIINAIHLSQEKQFKLQFEGVNELTHQVFEMVGLYQILEAIQEEVV
ncbi:STAS domain-containing protein [Halalkalibacter alkaliphilus]|uniref:Anti-sigma factor antagonist n=1 Tax=Halalkalibacter alkaliphilus TaxID=2917993 RepID=A0A9X2CRP2_9BACI|nr:STAS domain-containing protein [Halalkalibacter alkaliphilus]MCL7746714.1 STAS domain-containing protein [Halalkalibacter alkaliphilus]